MEVMDAAQFEVFASRVEKNCNVKFKYSLLAGTPPFEWIAGKKAAVTANEIMDWFSTKLSLAAKDVMKKSAKPEALQQFPARQHFVHCIQNHVGPYVRTLASVYVHLGVFDGILPRRYGHLRAHASCVCPHVYISVRTARGTHRAHPVLLAHQQLRV